MRRISALFVTLLCLAVLGDTPAFAPPSAAQRALEQNQTRFERVLRRPAGPAREREISTLIEGLLDYQELSRRALEAHWAGLTEAQRTEFVDLLKQLVARSYRSNLDRTLQYAVNYESAEAQTGGSVLVRTEARDTNNRRAPAVSIDYTMHQVGGAWRVFDLTIDDGLSMVQNYRRQFDRIVRRDGFDGLLGKMRERLAAE